MLPEKVLLSYSTVWCILLVSYTKVIVHERLHLPIVRSEKNYTRTPLKQVCCMNFEFFVKSKFNKWKISRNPNPKYKKIGAMQQLWQEYHFFRLDSMYSSRLNFRDQTKWGIEPSLNAVVIHYTIGIFCGKAIIIGAKSSRKTKLWT